MPSHFVDTNIMAASNLSVQGFFNASKLFKFFVIAQQIKIVGDLEAVLVEDPEEDQDPVEDQDQ